MRRACCRNVIDAAGVPRVAPRDPPGSQPQPADDSVGLDCGDRVRTTARIEPAALTEERADHAAIPDDRDDEQPGREAGTSRTVRTGRAARVDVSGLHCASAPSPTAGPGNDEDRRRDRPPIVRTTTRRRPGGRGRRDAPPPAAGRAGARRGAEVGGGPGCAPRHRRPHDSPRSPRGARPRGPPGPRSGGRDGRRVVAGLLAVRCGRRR